MPTRKPDQPRVYKVSLSNGRIEAAVVKAVIRQAEETRLQADFGFDETALVYLWQIRPQAL